MNMYVEGNSDGEKEQREENLGKHGSVVQRADRVI